jgi:hypothetical protein
MEKDERDYVSTVKSLEDQIKLLFARAFNSKLNPKIRKSLNKRGKTHKIE